MVTPDRMVKCSNSPSACGVLGSGMTGPAKELWRNFLEKSDTRIHQENFI